MKEINTVYVLTEYKRIPLFFSCKPFLDYEGSNFKFKIVFRLSKIFKVKNSQYLILIRHPKDYEDLDTLFLKLRERFKSIAYFDDEDSARIARPDIIKFVDVYFKKQLYKDKSLYLGRNQSLPTYVEYYRKKRTYEMGSFSNKLNELDLKKLHVAWNLSVGVYPMHTMKIRIASVLALIIGAKSSYRLLKFTTKLYSFPRKKKENSVSCQFSVPDDIDYGYQRNMIREIFSEDKNVIKTFKSERSYKLTLASSKITISPYGWGEVCFRDTEAILAGSVLVKPDMSHLETWPNIYQAFENYYPVDWDFNEIRQQVHEILQNEEYLEKIASKAKQSLFYQLSLTEDRVELFMSLMVGEKN